MLASAGQWRTACDIILKHKVTLTDELAEALSPPKENEMKDEEKDKEEYKGDDESVMQFGRRGSTVNAVMRKEILSVLASMAKKQESIRIFLMHWLLFLFVFPSANALAPILLEWRYHPFSCYPTRTTNIALSSNLTLLTLTSNMF